MGYRLFIPEGVVVGGRRYRILLLRTDYKPSLIRPFMGLGFTKSMKKEQNIYVNP